MMNGKQIEKNLALLSQKMKELGITGDFLMLGGAVMVTQVKNRSSTRDVDIVVATNDPLLYRTIKHAISLVAQEHSLPDEWLNDDVTVIIDQIGHPRKPIVWRRFDNLTVYVPELEYILALKLFAGRAQDDRDIQALAKKLQLDKHDAAWQVVRSYIPPMQLAIRIKDTEHAINRCFTQ